MEIETDFAQRVPRNKPYRRNLRMSSTKINHLQTNLMPADDLCSTIGRLFSEVYFILELQRMFEHSNIIRLRFSRTNLFYERTFVDARWSVFGAHFAERSFGRGLARGSHARMALPWPWKMKSCVDACQCHVPEISRERSGNMNFQLEEKHERQSF